MLGISMAHAVLAVQRGGRRARVSSRAFCSWPMNDLGVDQMCMMLMAELLRVMGTPMARICRIRCAAAGGDIQRLCPVPVASTR